MRLIDADGAELQDAIGRNAFKTRNDIRDLIDSLPTVNADLVVEAEWIPGDKMPNYPRIPYLYNRHYCSACEQPAVAYEHDRYDVVEFLTPRRPECGARMKNGC